MPQSEKQAAEAERRRRLLQAGAGGVFLAIVVVVALIAVGQNGGGSGGGSGRSGAGVGAGAGLKGAAAVRSLLAGIPQERMLLGHPGAPLTAIEFGDLQCPACKAYSEEVLPQAIEGPVRDGEAALEFRNFTIISRQSIPAGAAALAAGEQGRGWNYLELFYRNQGEEASGYVTDSFMTRIARGAGVPDIARWNRARKSGRLIAEVKRTSAEAAGLGFASTPSFALSTPRGAKPIRTPASAGELEATIEAAG